MVSEPLAPRLGSVALSVSLHITTSRRITALGKTFGEHTHTLCLCLGGYVITKELWGGLLDALLQLAVLGVLGAPVETLCN